MHKGLKVGFFLAAVCFFSLYGCKPGCKDPKALNFNPQAKTENGTCLYCDTSSTYSSAQIQGFDNSLGSNVANFIFNQTSLNNTGNGCASIGRSSLASCTVNLNIVNQTNTHMSGQCNITFRSGFTGDEWIASESFTSIGPFDTLKLGTINTSCDSIADGSFDVELFDMTYH